jgi:hypothetical protein
VAQDRQEHLLGLAEENVLDRGVRNDSLRERLRGTLRFAGRAADIPKRSARGARARTARAEDLRLGSVSQSSCPFLCRNPPRDEYTLFADVYHAVAMHTTLSQDLLL